MTATYSQWSNHRITERRRRRGRVLLVGTATGLVAALVAPELMAMVLGTVVLVGFVCSLLVGRAVLRTLGRPMSRLTVGDALVGGLILRWWHGRHDRPQGYSSPPVDRRWTSSRSEPGRRPDL